MDIWQASFILAHLPRFSEAASARPWKKFLLKYSDLFPSKYSLANPHSVVLGLIPVHSLSLRHVVHKYLPTWHRIPPPPKKNPFLVQSALTLVG